MTSMTFPASGPFGGARKSTPRKPRPAHPAAPVAKANLTTTGSKSTWITFLGDAFATWATAGRLPR